MPGYAESAHTPRKVGSLARGGVLRVALAEFFASTLIQMVTIRARSVDILLILFIDESVGLKFMNENIEIDEKFTFTGQQDLVGST